MAFKFNPAKIQTPTIDKSTGPNSLRSRQRTSFLPCFRHPPFDPLYVPWFCTQNLGHYVNCHYPDGSNRPADKWFHTATGEPGWPDKPTTRGFCDFDRTDPLPAASEPGIKEHRAEQGTRSPGVRQLQSLLIAIRLCSTTDTAICDVDEHRCEPESCTTRLFATDKLWTTCRNRYIPDVSTATTRTSRLSQNWTFFLFRREFGTRFLIWRN